MERPHLTRRILQLDLRQVLLFPHKCCYLRGRWCISCCVPRPVLWGSLHGTAAWTTLLLVVWSFPFVKLARLVIVAGLFLPHLLGWELHAGNAFPPSRSHASFWWSNWLSFIQPPMNRSPDSLIRLWLFREEKLVRYWEKEFQFRIGILTLGKWDPMFHFCPTFSRVGKGDENYRLIPAHPEY